MKRPTFLEGVAFAFAAAVTGGLALALLAPPLALGLVLRGVVVAASLAYLVYLLARSGARVGRATAVAGLAVTAVAAWWLAPSFLLFLLAHAGYLWLVRACLFRHSLVTALADLGLTALAVAAAVGATLKSGSLGLAIWTFFLVQALFVAIPSRLAGRREAVSRDAHHDDRFDRAHRAAEAAVRELMTQR